MTELHKTWDDIASNWHRWAPPLRPCKEDLDLLYYQLKGWISPNEPDDLGLGFAGVYLMGVTPEIVTMRYPFDYVLLGMDISENMVKEVWPGDIPHIRTGVVGDWFDNNMPPKSIDVVIADGSFVFFNRERATELSRITSSIMRKTGICLIRQFVAPEKKETIDDIERSLRTKTLTNFHELKFRVGMSLQVDSNEGVSQNQIYETVRILDGVENNPFFSNSDHLTLEFYKGKQSKLHFPTIQEYKDIFSKHFKNISVRYPEYAFGHCCPLITLTNPF